MQLRTGLNPYGLTYHLGLQGMGTPRANPQPAGLEGFIALATEIGVPYAAIALITDRDVGLDDAPGTEPVTMDEVFAMVKRNADVVRNVLARAVAALPDELFDDIADPTLAD